MDSVTPEIRSRIMAAVKSENTKPEMAIRRALHARGFRFRLHDKTLPGKPDIVFAKWSAVLLINGCYWHRHEGCKKTTTPTSNKRFWMAKFERNIARDRDNFEHLVSSGWRVGIVWECWIESTLDDASIDKVASFLKNKNCSFAEWP